MTHLLSNCQFRWLTLTNDLFDEQFVGKFVSSFTTMCFETVDFVTSSSGKVLLYSDKLFSCRRNF